MPFTPSQVLCLSLVASLLLVGGCEESYKPAPYKAAPRVSVGEGGSGPGRVDVKKTKARLPDVTNWTSPNEIGKAGSGSARGYRGIGGYRGNKGYRGMGGYRGINGGRNRNSYRGIKSYRGIRGSNDASGSRAYRGVDSNRVSASKYRGY